MSRMQFAAIGAEFVFLGIGANLGIFDRFLSGNFSEVLSFLKGNWMILSLLGGCLLTYAAINPSHRSRYSDYSIPTPTFRTHQLIHEVKEPKVAVRVTDPQTNLVLMKCPQCSGNLHFSIGTTVTDCKYCGAQVRLLEESLS